MEIFYACLTERGSRNNATVHILDGNAKKEAVSEIHFGAWPELIHYLKTLISLKSHVCNRTTGFQSFIDL